MGFTNPSFAPTGCEEVRLRRHRDGEMKKLLTSVSWERCSGASTEASGSGAGSCAASGGGSEAGSGGSETGSGSFGDGAFRDFSRCSMVAP